MHELSIATSLVDAVVGHLIESGGGSVRRVVVEVGELSGVVPAALQSAFTFAHRQEVSLEGATLEIRPVAVTLFCQACDREHPAVGVNALRCSECGASSSRVVRGRELDIVAIEVMNAAPDA
ncbi:MAG: hypA [Phycisphaerales bacterium]|nr:hypA [Phycisphaerales bacterium]